MLDRPLWVCPKCGNAFVNRNNWHSCVRVPLDSHFHGNPKARALFSELRRAVEEAGPVRIVSSKTRICFMVRVRFANCSARRGWLRAGVWLPYPIEHPKAIAREFIPPRYHLLSFAIRGAADIDARLKRLLRDAYFESGCQEHQKRERA